MARHITDHPRQSTPGRLRQYLGFERAESPAGIIRRIRSHGDTAESARRVQEFLRIARGRDT